MPEDHPKGILSAATEGKRLRCSLTYLKFLTRKRNQSDIQLLRMLQVWLTKEAQNLIGMSGL